MNICTAKCLVHYENLWTFELTYPRYIHSEFMTHRMFSRNASSSRAVPVAKVIQQVASNPVIPPKVYMNKAGMVGDVEADTTDTVAFYNLWLDAATNAVNTANEMEKIGIHKQHINRILEPFQFIHVIVTATEWSNFFRLRLAPDAQPEMQDLANAIYDEMVKHKYESFGYISLDGSGSPCAIPRDYCTIVTLPYVTEEDINKVSAENYITLMKVSSARCARVSYNNHDGSKPDIEKDLKLFERLSEGGHMSPLEHTCIRNIEYVPSANLMGWESLRYLLENHKVKL